MQELADAATSKEDFRKIEQWLLDNGYAEKYDLGGLPFLSQTAKFRNNPALSGSNIIKTVQHLYSPRTDLTKEADKANFAVDSSSRVPAGFQIHQSNGVNGSENDWFITKGSYIVKDGFASYEDALAFLRSAATAKAKKRGSFRNSSLPYTEKGRIIAAETMLSGRITLTPSVSGAVSSGTG